MADRGSLAAQPAGSNAVRRSALSVVRCLSADPSARQTSRDEGSAIIEGVAAIGIAFILLTLVVQVATAVTAHSTARAAAAASARRAALPNADAAIEAARLRDTVHATVPGARDIEVSIDTHNTVVRAIVSFRWVPPGPDLHPFQLEVSADVPLVVAP